MMTVVQSAETLFDLGREVFAAVGAPPDIAHTVADHLVNANLAGHDSHGVLRIPAYVKAVQRGDIVPDAVPSLVRQTPAGALLDANWGFGQVAARRLAELAIDLARRQGVAAVGAIHCNHIGRLGEYSALAARSGVILFVTTGGRGGVAPFGGARGALGTNPISIGFPMGDREPILVDFATASVAAGKIAVARDREERLAPGTILDRNGYPTTDPKDYYDGGVLLPVGGHKGYGLSLVAALLSGPLVGAEDLGVEEGAGGSGPRRGCLMIGLDAGLFRDPSEVVEGARALGDRVKATPTAPGTEEVLLPGEPETRLRAQRLREGIPLPDTTWQALTALRQSLVSPQLSGP